MLFVFHGFHSMGIFQTLLNMQAGSFFLREGVCGVRNVAFRTAFLIARGIARALIAGIGQKAVR